MGAFSKEAMAILKRQPEGYVKPKYDIPERDNPVVEKIEDLHSHYTHDWSASGRVLKHSDFMREHLYNVQKEVRKNDLSINQTVDKINDYFDGKKVAHVNSRGDITLDETSIQGLSDLNNSTLGQHLSARAGGQNKRIGMRLSSKNAAKMLPELQALNKYKGQNIAENPPTHNQHIQTEIKGETSAGIMSSALASRRPTISEKDFNVLRETEKAAFVSVEGQQPVWLPKSTFKRDYDTGNVSVSNFAIKKINEGANPHGNNPFTDRIKGNKTETPKQSTSLMAKTLGKTGRMYSTGGTAGEWTAEMREAANARSAEQHSEWTPELADAANARTRK